MTTSSEPREHLDVLVIGAGLSGVAAGHYLQTDCPWASYAVLEARDSIGGTWDLFRYPGIRSDSDMHTLGYPFRPWDGEKSIADGADILQYIKDTAAEEGIDRHIRFQHRVVAADWSTPEARWHVTAERTDTGDTVHLTASFVLSCSGYYRYDQGYEPDFPGRSEFRGTVVHPQHWPEDLDYEGTRIVVIGSGATAVTLIPALARTGAGHVTMLQRSPTYIVSVPDKSFVVRLLRFLLPDRWAGSILRWAMALGTQGSYFLSKRRPELVKRVLRRGIKRQLPKGYPIDPHFTPTYDPWDQRLCVVPNGDLFKAIRKGTASVVTDTIEGFTDKGVRVSSGAELEADIVVTATGLQMQFVGGMQVTVDGEEVDVPNRYVYKGMMLEGVPNVAMAIGYTNASWTLKTDLTCQYVTRLLNHMRATGMRQCTPTNTDPTLTEAPLLGLDSGYIRRAAHEFPKAGSRFPWQVHQSFVRDYQAMTMKPVVDDAMAFSNLAPAKAETAAAS